MSAINRTPANHNLLHPNKFQLNFSRLPNTTFFCQSVNLPGVSLGEILQSTPFIDLYRPGEKLLYDTLNVTFMVDEDLNAWKDIHDWIRALTFPTDFSEYRRLPQLQQAFAVSDTPQYSDASLTLLTSANNVNYRVKLYECFPTSLSSIIFSASDSPESVLSADATFRFSYFDIETA